MRARSQLERVSRDLKEKGPEFLAPGQPVSIVILSEAKNLSSSQPE
jgi:hypothetical protein